MIVVCDTSPITNLAAIGQLTLLRELFGEIYVPKEVRSELNAYGMHWPGAEEIDQATWVCICEVENAPLFLALQRDLDPGEAASIAVALSMNATLILLDEMDGRRAAQRMGLSVLGTLGVLLSAKSKKLIANVRPLLDALRSDAGFYIGSVLYNEVLRLAQE